MAVTANSQPKQDTIIKRLLSQPFWPITTPSQSNKGRAHRRPSWHLSLNLTFTLNLTLLILLTQLQPWACILHASCAQGPKSPRPKWPHTHSPHYHSYGDINIANIAAWCDFFVKWLTFLQIFHKPQLRPRTYFFRRPINRRFQRCIVCTEIMSIFHAQVEYVSLERYTIQTNGNEIPSNLPFPLGHIDPNLIHPSLNWPQLKIPNDSSIGSLTSAQLCSKDSINETPHNGHIYLQIASSPFDDHHPHPIHPSLTNSTHHPNGIQIQSSILPQYTFRTDRQTERQMG